MGPFVIILENLSKPRPKTPEIPKNLGFRFFIKNPRKDPLDSYQGYLQDLDKILEDPYLSN